MTVKQLSPIVLIFFLLFCRVSVAQEQPVAEDKPEYDPIVAMLDSLVKLEFLTRTSETEEYRDVTEDVTAPVKTYTDKEYADKMRRINSPIPLAYNQQVKNYIDLYAYKRRTSMGRMMGLSKYYYPMFEEVLDRYDLPLELKHLAIVESALNPLAVSRMGATGIWQFMYNTGKMYNLKVTSYIDDRRDPYKATIAAAEYFRNMYAIYKDWLLVIAAYNCGPGNVNKAIARAGGSTNFWQISRFLPSETRGYVPAFIAVCYVMNYPSDHNIYPVAPPVTYFEVDTITVDRSISFKYLAEGLGMTVEEISYLNPVFKKQFIPANDDVHYLRLPSNKIGEFIANYDSIFNRDAVIASQSIAQVITSDDDYIVTNAKKYYKVKSGDNLSAIAKKFKCGVSDIKRWNNLRSNNLKVGQRLIVYAPAKKPLSTSEKAITDPVAVVTDTSMAKPPEKSVAENDGKFIYHTVQPGDTLWQIAQRYEGVTVQQLIRDNNIDDSRSLKPGMKIKVAVGG